MLHLIRKHQLTKLRAFLHPPNLPPTAAGRLEMLAFLLSATPLCYNGAETLLLGPTFRLEEWPK